MARWSRGESEVSALLGAGDLQKLTGEAANGERLLEKAAVTLTTARSAIERDPDSGFVLAYDAARQALTGLLAHQGLRPTTKGGHYAVERAVARSSAQASVNSAHYAAATSWSTPNAQTTTPPATKRVKQSRTHRPSSPRLPA